MADTKKKISNAISLAENIHEDLKYWADPETAMCNTRDLISYLKKIEDDLNG